jgi:hypothetical protein
MADKVKAFALEVGLIHEPLATPGEAPAVPSHLDDIKSEMRALRELLSKPVATCTSSRETQERKKAACEAKASKTTDASDNATADARIFSQGDAGAIKLVPWVRWQIKGINDHPIIA